MNKVWVLIREEDWFYDNKYTYLDVFETLEDARNYMTEYLEVLLFELETDYSDGNSFYEDIDINDYRMHEKREDVVTLYMDDAYFITLGIEEKEIMKMGGCQS